MFREAGASKTAFPSWSLGTSKKYLRLIGNHITHTYSPRNSNRSCSRPSTPWLWCCICCRARLFRGMRRLRTRRAGLQTRGAFRPGTFFGDQPVGWVGAIAETQQFSANAGLRWFPTSRLGTRCGKLQLAMFREAGASKTAFPSWSLGMSNNSHYKCKVVFKTIAVIICNNNTLQAIPTVNCCEAQTGGFIFSGVAYE